MVALAGLLGPVGHVLGKLLDGWRNHSGFPQVFLLTLMTVKPAGQGRRLTSVAEILRR